MITSLQPALGGLYEKHAFRPIGVGVSIGLGVCSPAASNEQNVSAASIMQSRGVPSSFRQISAHAVEMMQLYPLLHVLSTGWMFRNEISV
jgi:hypothetical protein